ncbi:MAG: hypothetical protein J3K34DRAFT_280146 [Monoraphidium minutum]|nr:MAG: hypothetical protein J3K34DRAFT_280146 [Monoraphidium minutum]
MSAESRSGYQADPSARGSAAGWTAAGWTAPRGRKQAIHFMQAGTRQIGGAATSRWRRRIITSSQGEVMVAPGCKTLEFSAVASKNTSPSPAPLPRPRRAAPRCGRRRHLGRRVPRRATPRVPPRCGGARRHIGRRVPRVDQSGQGVGRAACDLACARPCVGDGEVLGAGIGACRDPRRPRSRVTAVFSPRQGGGGAMPWRAPQGAFKGAAE